MTPPADESQSNDLYKEHEQAAADMDSNTDDEVLADSLNGQPHGGGTVQEHLSSLDDDALFGVFKKMVGYIFMYDIQCLCSFCCI